MKAKIASLVLMLVWLRSGPAVAQSVSDAGPDPARVRIRVGPLMLHPTIELSNLGIDTNVFNEPSDANPKRDFTLTATPRTEAWLRLGRSWLGANVREDLVWYKTYDSERSANTSISATWKMPLNRLLVEVSPRYLSTRDRPGYEIDARSQRREYGARGAIELRALSKTFVGVTASSDRIDFDSVTIFDGVNLREALNRKVRAGGLSIRHQLTPLTSLSFAMTREESRFEFSPLRDSDSTAVTGAVSFDPFALVKGTAKIGYRNFHPLSTGLSDYRGMTASGDLSYTLLGMTRFGVQFTRDVQYSYEINQPYYLQTGVVGSITQQVFGPFDVMVRAGTQRLAYRDRAGAFVAMASRVDRVETFGGGIGYHLGSDMRLGFNLDNYHRTSDRSSRRFDALRFGMSVTYGL